MVRVKAGAKSKSYGFVSVLGRSYGHARAHVSARDRANAARRKSA